MSLWKRGHAFQGRGRSFSHCIECLLPGGGLLPSTGAVRSDMTFLMTIAAHMLVLAIWIITFSGIPFVAGLLRINSSGLFSFSFTFSCIPHTGIEIVVVAKMIAAPVMCARIVAIISPVIFIFVVRFTGGGAMKT